LQPNPLLLATVFQLASLSASTFTFGSEDVRSELIPRYLAAVEARKSAGVCVTAEVTVRAKLSDRQAELHAVRITSTMGDVTHRVLEARGDGTVRREVIGRYLEAEAQANQLDEIAITPSHYRFRFLRTVLQAGRRVHIFQLSPKQKRVGLFKGELWLDAATGMPVRETGTLVKTPSILLKSVSFENEYELKNGVAWPSHIICHVDTRVAGRADLNIRFSNVTKADESDDPKEIAEAP
jgi:hypothetical protein